MYCPNCGNPVDPNTGVCTNCNPQPVNVQPVRNEITEKDLPEKFSPLGAWTYFWLSVLFSIPVVGFVFLIVFSFSDGNINRRNFARSHWCALLIVGILVIILAVIFIITGVSVSGVLRDSAVAYPY